MNDLIIKGEIYSRLSVLLKQYTALLEQEFPTSGSKTLIKLVISIIQKLQIRIEIFTSTHLKHIGTLIRAFERYCGYLYDSQNSNIPWSVIPSLEKLFSQIDHGCEFVICPLWETNYKIINQNVLKELEKTITLPGLIFDKTDKYSFDEETRSFLKPYNKGIYFIFFPRMERLSSLHFALLGHELGHRYAIKWQETQWSNFSKSLDLDASFEKTARAELEKLKNVDGPLFSQYFVVNHVLITRKILNELISDIYGAYIFGETAFLATFIFAIKMNLDDTSAWEKGYLSWRYRLKFIYDALFQNQTKETCFLQQSKWKQSIENVLSQPVKDNIDKPNDYLKIILDGIELKKKDIWNNIKSELDVNYYENHIIKDEIESARKRIANKIIPNANIDDNLKEYPLELRNILYATWMELGENIKSNAKDYEYASHTINLLSLKGIELSVEQSNFNTFMNKPSKSTH